LGPGLLALALFDKYNDRLTRGGAPGGVRARAAVLYMLHILVIHLLAAVAIALAFHQPAGWLLHGAIFMNLLRNGYGHNLPFIYLASAAICLALYFPPLSCGPEAAAQGSVVAELFVMTGLIARASG
jgi:hypothetical protein